mmetsp:Transcript_22357/g.64097  ORF Transcript_22357/g.64097 Transcript_22357/m.64097 type:complete len:246 (+) Transcript_22357:710-1447(+)
MHSAPGVGSKSTFPRTTAIWPSCLPLPAKMWKRTRFRRPRKTQRSPRSPWLAMARMMTSLISGLRAETMPMRGCQPSGSCWRSWTRRSARSGRRPRPRKKRRRCRRCWTSSVPMRSAMRRPSERSKYGKRSRTWAKWRGWRPKIPWPSASRGRSARRSIGGNSYRRRAHCDHSTTSTRSNRTVRTPSKSEPPGRPRSRQSCKQPATGCLWSDGSRSRPARWGRCNQRLRRRGQEAPPAAHGSAVR